MLSFVAYNVVFGLMVSHVDNAAHVGGLVAGIAIGWLVGRRAFAARPRLAQAIVPAVLTIGLAITQVAWLGGRLDWRHLPGFRADLENADAWSAYLAAHEEAWQLRLRGLHARDVQAIREAEARERKAVAALQAVLARPRPKNPD